MGSSGTQRSGRIAQNSIEQVLQRSDLADLVSGFTQLRKQGAEFTGRCPFHDERTPSFWVNPTKGVYHCFGCGASGDTIGFVQEKQGLDFVEAIEFLADRYRVQLEFEGTDGVERAASRVKKTRLTELMETTSGFYEAYLWQSTGAAHARAYLSGRDISTETAKAFRMGFSPEGRDTLVTKATAKGFTREELTEARLVTSRGGDFFHGRLMVPIIDRADRIVGFGARKLRDEQFGGKYINSADGRLFHKKETIFAAPDIRESAAKAEHIIVVEGYMDVIALYQAGFRNVCAVMGTSLTEQQVVELKRLAPQACFAFDPDAAGQVATLRALEMARGHELDVRVILLTDGDPADIVAGPEGRERMGELLDESVSLLHYRVSSLLGSGDLSADTGREHVWREGLKFFATIPDSPERKRQIDRFGFGLQLDTEAVQMLQRATGSDQPLPGLSSPARGRRESPRSDGQTRQRQQRTGDGAQQRALSPRMSAALQVERRFLGVALVLLEDDKGGELAPLGLEAQHFLTEGHRRAWALLLERAVAGGTVEVAAIREDTELAGLFAELATGRESREFGTTSDDASELARELALALQVRRVERETRSIAQQLAERPDAEDLLQHMVALAAERHRLRGAQRASGSEGDA